MIYRKEIDGLRALAVIPVILFHAGFETFSGGFVGVDVFFVISGYLIALIILADMEAGTFSLSKFYERRARRILPALFLVMFVCLPFAWLWMTPLELKSFSKSVLAVSVFSSNILFWRESGYFGAASELKPLLHTWSLAVEEQYYLLFPIFLLLVWKIGRRWIVVSLFGVFLLSLAAAQWGSLNKPSATFYLLPTRGWELLSGVFLALFLFSKTPAQTLSNANSIVRTGLTLMGLLLITYSIFAFNKDTPFPSVYTLIPVVGTLLILWFADGGTVVGRLLGSGILVGIGLISYSAYLWHQPLFAFARLRSPTEPHPLSFILLSVASVFLAYLSWKYVETPFRNSRWIGSKRIFASGLLGIVVLVGFGSVGLLTQGFDQRTDPDGELLRRLDLKVLVNHGLSDVCETEFTLSAVCRTSEEPEILVWGDSFAMHLVDGIVSSNPSVKMIQLTKSVCGPFFNLAPITPTFGLPFAKTCLEFTQHVKDWLVNQKSIKYAVLGSPFSQYFSESSKVLIGENILPADNDLVLAEFLKTLKILTSLGITPIIFSPPPSSGGDIGGCLQRSKKLGLSLDNCDFELNGGEVTSQTSKVDQFLREVEKQYRVVWLDKMLCRANVCKSHFGSTFIFRDSGHLSKEGSSMLGKRFDWYDLIVRK